MTDWMTRTNLLAAIGVVVFAAAGAAAGTAMKPSPRELIGPEGPQMLAPVSGERIKPTSGGGSAFADYKYGIPDYVIGTDWLEPEVPEAPVVEIEAAQLAPYTPPHFISLPRRAPEPARERPPARYPSIGGDIYAVAPEPHAAPQPPRAPEPPEPPEPPAA